MADQERKSDESLKEELDRLNAEFHFDPPLAIPDNAELDRRRRVWAQMDEIASKIGPFPRSYSEELVRDARREAERRVIRRVK